MIIAVAIALEQYFFCKSLTDSIFWTAFSFIIFLGCFNNLPINRVPAPKGPQKGKNCHKNTFCAQPPVQIAPDKKAEKNTTGHGQANLHDERQVLGPNPMAFIINRFFL